MNLEAAPQVAARFSLRAWPLLTRYLLAGARTLKLPYTAFGPDLFQREVAGQIQTVEVSRLLTTASEFVWLGSGINLAILGLCCCVRSS